MYKEPCRYTCEAIPPKTFRPDMADVDFGVRKLVFNTIAQRFFKGIESCFGYECGSSATPVKYGIKYRDPGNSGLRHTYADETGMVRCIKYLDDEIDEVAAVSFHGEEIITTRLFEEFKKFALEQKLEEIVREALAPPRLVTYHELAREELKKFADKHKIKYTEKIELR